MNNNQKTQAHIPRQTPSSLKDYIKQSLNELSERVANKLNIKPYTGVMEVNDKSEPTGKLHGTWLHEDDARCFSLMCQYKAFPVVSTLGAEYISIGSRVLEFTNQHQDVNSAVRIAILKHLDIIIQAKDEY